MINLPTNQVEETIATPVVKNYTPTEEIIKTKLEEEAKEAMAVLEKIEERNYSYITNDNNYDHITVNFAEDRSFDVTYKAGYITALGVTYSWSPDQN